MRSRSELEPTVGEGLHHLPFPATSVGRGFVPARSTAAPKSVSVDPPTPTSSPHPSMFSCTSVAREPQKHPPRQRNVFLIRRTGRRKPPLERVRRSGRRRPRAVFVGGASRATARRQVLEAPPPLSFFFCASLKTAIFVFSSPPFRGGAHPRTSDSFSWLRSPRAVPTLLSPDYSFLGAHAPERGVAGQKGEKMRSL